MTLMKISQQGIDLIKRFEGCKLSSYKDSVGVWTIGYGHTKGVRSGMSITQQQAEQFMKEDIQPIERTLNSMCVNFKQQQFDALVSWIFNLGVGNFNKSTMKKWITGNFTDEDITDQMVKWVNAGGIPLLGLKRRRVAEANMFLGREVYYLDGSNNIKKR